MKQEPIEISLIGVSVEQFATMEVDNKDSGSLKISASAKYNYNERAVGIAMNIQFASPEATFLIIKTLSHFVIGAESWNKLSKEMTEDVVLPKLFLDQLNSIAISTTRGILVGKTEGTEYSKFFLPLVDAAQLGSTDLILERNPAVE